VLLSNKRAWSSKHCRRRDVRRERKTTVGGGGGRGRGGDGERGKVGWYIPAQERNCCLPTCVMMSSAYTHGLSHNHPTRKNGECTQDFCTTKDVNGYTSHRVFKEMDNILVCTP
jgi:hypothetical protein